MREKMTSLVVRIWLHKEFVRHRFVFTKICHKYVLDLLNLLTLSFTFSTHYSSYSQSFCFYFFVFLFTKATSKLKKTIKDKNDKS